MSDTMNGSSRFPHPHHGDGRSQEGETGETSPV
jgi:hypothetical protein